MNLPPTSLLAPGRTHGRRLALPILFACATFALAPSAAARPSGSATAAGQDEAADPVLSKKAVLQWRGRKHKVVDLPDDLPAAAADAVRAWANWTVEQRYQALLNDDGRVLLLTPTKSSGARRLALVERTVAHFDAVLPVPASRAKEAPLVPEEPTGEARGPQEDGGGDAPADEADPEGGGGRYTSHSWIEDGGPLETETAVILELGTRADQAAVVSHLTATHPYLGNFEVGALAGFSLERPLVAAWLASEPENEEWNPDAELVHRTATLLFLRRFGRQPFWLQTGTAWQAEQSLIGGMWCFPYRAEFIWAVEHTAWPLKLQDLFDGRNKPTFRIHTVSDWARGTFLQDEAVLAWGVAAWFATERPGVLSEILEDLRRYHDENNRTEHAPGQWRRVPGWEPSSGAQREIFERHTSAELWDELTRAFKKARTAAWARPQKR